MHFIEKQYRLTKKYPFFTAAINFKYTGMNSIKTNFFRSISILLMLFALTFSTNVEASSTMTTLTPNDENEEWSEESKESEESEESKESEESEESKESGSSGGGTPGVPLDGGLGILALGAAAFGVRKLRGNKHENI